MTKMGEEKKKSKKRLVFIILGALFLIAWLSWTSLTQFETNKNRVIFIVLIILLFGLLSLGGFLKEKWKD